MLIQESSSFLDCSFPVKNVQIDQRLAHVLERLGRRRKIDTARVDPSDLVDKINRLLCLHLVKLREIVERPVESRRSESHVPINWTEFVEAIEQAR